MIIVRNAKKSDLPAIEELLRVYSKFSVTDKYVNHRDMSFVAYDGPRCVGFLWVGLMASNTVAYIDKFCIHPDYSRQGIAKKMGEMALLRGMKIGVRECFGVIKADDYHNKCALDALKMGMGAHKEQYTYVCADPSHMVQELGG